MSNPQVNHIVIDVDSPGGSVTGVTELATKIRSARGIKPITAFASGTMASAAYWISSAADRIVATPSADVGSIGVLALHTDMSGALEQEGIKPTFVVSNGSPHKVEGNPFEALSEDARQQIQADVDEIYEVFIADIAKSRGVTKSTVRKDYGQGRVLSASRAKQAGIIDDIATMDYVLMRTPARKSNRKAMQLELAKQTLDVSQ